MAGIRLWSGLVSIPLLSVGLACASAQVQSPPPEQHAPLAQPDQNLESAAVPRAESTKLDLHEPDSPPVSSDPPARDETVGLGSAVDRAPRDIREPFDE
jgi:hypothetical protein